jgi:SAM-dependent methyltransferase
MIQPNRDLKRVRLSLRFAVSFGVAWLETASRPGKLSPRRIKMDRRAQLLKYITKDQKGIEIGPWFAPLAPKREGYNCLSFDIFDTDTLKRIAEQDPGIPKNQINDIENVDIVGSAVNIRDVIAAHGDLGSFDYIVSSHNFEHLPDPVRFLQGCECVLKADGMLSMAIPDKRTCFDYFRPISTLGSWLEAFFDKRTRPTPLQLFEHNSLSSEYAKNGKRSIVFPDVEDPKNVIGLELLKDAYNHMIEMKRSDNVAYRDAHCSMLTSSSFSLMVLDLTFLGLISLSIEEIIHNDCEFHVHIRNRTIAKPKSDGEFYSERQDLLHCVMNECAYNSTYAFELRQKHQLGANSLVSTQAKLDEIKNSITWKIASPLWRLETRRQRKEARRRLSAMSDQQ